VTQANATPETVQIDRAIEPIAGIPWSPGVGAPIVGSEPPSGAGAVPRQDAVVRPDSLSDAPGGSTAKLGYMAGPIHDDEPDTTESTVRTLLERQCPQWADLPLSSLQTSGSDNAMWRLHAREGHDLVVRLPRRISAAASIGQELELLQHLRATTPLAADVRTPMVRHVGHADDAFAHQWGVLEWLDGVDAWTARRSLQGDRGTLALDVARIVRALGRLPDMVVAEREPGDRGGPIEPLLHRLAWWLTDPRWNAASLVDVKAVKHIAAKALELAGAPVTKRFVHGDLIPGNLLVRRGSVSAVIDWGSAAIADPAQDLAPAWALFDKHGRDTFRDAVGADDATWLRAQAFELEHAVGGVLYYTPRRHPLGDVMARTLNRILEDT